MQTYDDLISKTRRKELLWMVCSILGAEPSLHSTIDEMYSVDPLLYHEYSKSNQFLDTDFVLGKALENEIRVRKVIGLLKEDMKSEPVKYSNIIKLARKGFKKTVQYIDNGKEIKLRSLLDSFVEKTTNVKSDNSVFRNGIIAIWYADYLGKRIVPDSSYENVVAGFEQLIASFTPKGVRLSVLLRGSESSIDDRKYLDSLWKLKVSSMTPRAYLEGLVRNKLDELITETLQRMTSFRDFSDITDDVDTLNTKLQNQSYREVISRYEIPLNSVCRAYGVTLDEILENSKLTKEDMALILRIIEGSLKKNLGMKQEERDILVVMGIVLKAFSESYLKSKELYFSRSEDKLFLEVKKKEQQLSEREQQLRKRDQELTSELSAKTSRIQELESLLQESERKVTQLTRSIEKKEDNTKELIALREYMFKSNEDEEEEPRLFKSVTMIEMVKKANNKKIAIVGGHLNWIKKMQQALPSVTFMPIEACNRDLSFLREYIAVFEYWGCFKHKYHEKLMRDIEGYPAKLFFFKEHVNIDITISQMYDDLTESDLL